MHVRLCKLPIQIALLFFFLTFQLNVFAQKESIIDELLDLMTSEATDEQTFDTEALYDDLVLALDNPVNLNSATKNDLDKLPFLSDIQIENILYYRYQFGAFYSIHELQLIDDLDELALRFLPYFVYVDKVEKKKKTSIKEIFTRSKNEFLVRLDGTFEKKQGYNRTKEELAANPDKYYLGDPFYTSFKYRFDGKGKLQFGLTAEKDAGEQFWGKYNKGYDSYNGYIQLNDLWKFSTIVVGDYRATFGQGLVMRTEFQSANTSVLQAKTRNYGFRRNTSTDEYNFLRGVAATAKFGPVDVSAFYSFRQMDADTSGGSFSSIRKDGYHRRVTEWEKKRTLKTHVVGGNVSYNHAKFHVGLTAAATLFGVPKKPNEKVVSTFLYEGKNMFSASVDYSFRIYKFNFWGETALCNNLGVATVNGVSFTPVSVMGILLSHRYFSPKYDFMYSQNIFGSSSSNENGFYMGVELQPIKKWRIEASADIQQRPWVSTNTTKSAWNYELRMRLNYVPNSRMNYYAQVVYRENERNLSDVESVTKQIGKMARTRLTCHAQYQIGDVKLTNKVVFTHAEQEQSDPTFGFAISQDISYKIPIVGISLNARYLYFDAKDYNNRITLYENDVPFAFSIPTLYGRGSRYYLNVGYNVLKNFSIWLKFAQTYYDDRSEIGSGLDLIQKNRKSDFRVQLRVKF